MLAKIPTSAVELQVASQWMVRLRIPLKRRLSSRGRLVIPDSLHYLSGTAEGP